MPASTSLAPKLGCKRRMLQPVDFSFYEFTVVWGLRVNLGIDRFFTSAF